MIRAAAASAPSPKLLDLVPAAEHIGISPRHLRQLQYERRIPFVHVGRRVYFRVADLDQWVEDLATLTSPS